MGLLAPKLLTSSETEKLILEKTQWILSLCEPQSLVLFGSAARGEMTEASDLDLALIFPNQIILETARKNLYISPPTGQLWPMDLLFYTLEEFKQRVNQGGVCELIRKEGRLLSGEWS